VTFGEFSKTCHSAAQDPAAHGLLRTQQNKIHGIYIAFPYESLRPCIKFSYAYVSRQASLHGVITGIYTRCNMHTKSRIQFDCLVLEMV
jgi:hypothetical protein